MKKISHLLLCIILFITLFASCSRDDDKSNETQNDFLIKSELVAEVDAATIKSRLPQAATLVNSGVKAYKIFYKTEFPSGNSITASGLIIVPAERSGELTLLGFLHGTITTNEEAPSSYLPVGNMEAFVAGTVGASLAKNYMVVMPDYIGFGESKQLPHPYQEKASLASACLDMLKAAKEFADEMNLETRKEIRLLGYSEGGYAAMATHQAIEERASDWFTVEESYPGAGAYDMVGTAQWMVSQSENLPPGATSFYLWTFLTYNDLYKLNIPLTDVILPKHAAAVSSALAQGNFQTAPIPNNPAELFTPQFIESIKTGTHPLFMPALQQNNVYNWKPNTPVILFHGAADKIVPVLNTEKASQTMTSLGAQVQVQPLGNIGHREAIPNYITAVIARLAG